MSPQDIAEIVLTGIEIDAMTLVVSEIEKDGDKLNNAEKQLIEVGIAAGIVRTLETLEALGIIPEDGS